MNIKEQILGSTLNLHTFAVPSWGFSVTIRAWTVAEYQQWSDWQKGKEHTVEIFAKAAVMSLCDEQSGVLLFDDTRIPELMQKDFSALNLICENVVRINGLKPDDNFRKKD